MQEKNIVKRARKGDTDAFAQLIESRREKIYKIAYSYTKNREDALDIVSEATYKAFISINKLKQPEYFNTWFTRILINCAINYMNKSKRIISIDENVVDLNKNDEKDTLVKEEIMDLYNAIDKLDYKHKTVIILKYIEDLTISDMAEVLDWPIGTVKTYLNRALNNLRIELEEV